MFAQDQFTTKARRMLTSGFFLLVFASSLSITLTLAYASLGTTPHERFITLSTVGSDMTTRSIYPSSNAFVGRGEALNWNVRVYNHMGDTEYVAIRVKLLNATQFGPEEALHLPSPVNHVYEEKRILADNATMTVPLGIILKDVSVAAGDSKITSISINGKDIEGLAVSNDNSNSFRFIIELWRYDTKFEDFVYTWPSGPESESAWNQIRIMVK